MAYKSDYEVSAWKELLKSELNAMHPICYSGDDGTNGHEWVCDGWRWSDDMFHMNWGWSGYDNGWFTIGALNPWGNGSYNANNTVVIGIKPGNTNLIARFTNLKAAQMVGFGPVIGVNCDVIKGTASAVNLYFDNILIYSTPLSSFTYNLVTTK
jgi:hypothetical protein